MITPFLGSFYYYFFYYRMSICFVFFLFWRVNLGAFRILILSYISLCHSIMSLTNISPFQNSIFRNKASKSLISVHNLILPPPTLLRTQNNEKISIIIQKQHSERRKYIQNVKKDIASKNNRETFQNLLTSRAPSRELALIFYFETQFSTTFLHFDVNKLLFLES